MAERRSTKSKIAAAVAVPQESKERRRSPNRIPVGSLAIPDRLKADRRHTGKGVVAAFLDAGFYAHPDLVTPHSRIHAYHDLIWFKDGVDQLKHADPSSWHGMMSTVVAAGNGTQSDGRFRSLAPDLGLVLVKVGNMSRVLHDDIARGIEWVLTHRARYDIRILNISCGGDYEASHLDDIISRFAEAAIRAGVVIVAAAGNDAGELPQYPANFPGVISVTAVDAADHKADFANFGASWVDLASPGVGITSTVPVSPPILYAAWSGTSMAAPFAAGAAALARQQHPTASPAEIAAQLIDAGREIDTANPAYAGKLGRMLDIASALGIAPDVGGTPVTPIAPATMLYLPLTLRQN